MKRLEKSRHFQWHKHAAQCRRRLLMTARTVKGQVHQFCFLHVVISRLANVPQASTEYSVPTSIIAIHGPHSLASVLNCNEYLPILSGIKQTAREIRPVESSVYFLFTRIKYHIPSITGQVSRIAFVSIIRLDRLEIDGNDGNLDQYDLVNTSFSSLPCSKSHALMSLYLSILINTEIPDKRHTATSKHPITTTISMHFLIINLITVITIRT